MNTNSVMQKLTEKELVNTIIALEQFVQDIEEEGNTPSDSTIEELRDFRAEYDSRQR